MRQRYRIEVPQYLVDRSKLFAEKLCAHFASGGSPASRAVSGDRGIESNPVLQAQAKIGECAAAILFGLNPLTEVKWNLIPDKGSDLIVDDVKFDVKTTLPPFKLIWSRDVNHLYHSKEFDHLVSVSIDEKNWRECSIEGYMPKATFFERKKISDGKNSRLEVDTWFMDKRDLYDMADLDLPLFEKSESAKKTVVESKPSIHPLVRVCQQCKKQHDGTEREVWVSGFMLWLHEECEDAYIRRLR
jgi:hypothetical protein